MLDKGQETRGTKTLNNENSNDYAIKLITNDLNKFNELNPNNIISSTDHNNSEIKKSNINENNSRKETNQNNYYENNNSHNKNINESNYNKNIIESSNNKNINESSNNKNIEHNESQEGSKNTRFIEYFNKSKTNDRKIIQISDKLEKNSNSHFNVNGNDSNNKTKSNNKGHCYQRSQTLNNLSISENKKNYLEENIDDIIQNIEKSEN